jgi:competence protein ComEC
MRILFPFLSGIIVALLSEPEPLLPFWVIVSPVALLFLAITFPLFSRQYKKRWMTGLLIHGSLFLFAFNLTCQKISTIAAEEIGVNPEGWMVGEITEAVSVKKKICRSVISVRYIHRDGKWSPLCGKSMLYLKPGKEQEGIQYGDHIIFYAVFQKVPDNSNPSSFNYSRYLKNKGIQYSVWLEPGDWKTLRIETTNPLRKLSFQLRDRLLDRIRNSNLGNDEFAVAAALLLGYVDELGSDLRAAYSATGVTHILSVSGMHVGIIFLFLEFMLGFLNRSRLC